MAADPFGRHMSKMYGDRYSMIRDRDGTFAGSDNSGKRLTVLDSA